MTKTLQIYLSLEEIEEVAECASVAGVEQLEGEGVVEECDWLPCLRLAGFSAFEISEQVFLA
jgi:hypothetical protein